MRLGLVEAEAVRWVVWIFRYRTPVGISVSVSRGTLCIGIFVPLVVLTNIDPVFPKFLAPAVIVIVVSFCMIGIRLKAK